MPWWSLFLGVEVPTPDFYGSRWEEEVELSRLLFQDLWPHAGEEREGDS